ncbi:hypothetical protein ACJX0J_007002, partial [Zea mays]
IHVLYPEACIILCFTLLLAQTEYYCEKGNIIASYSTFQYLNTYGAFFYNQSKNLPLIYNLPRRNIDQ